MQAGSRQRIEGMVHKACMLLWMAAHTGWCWSAGAGDRPQLEIRVSQSEYFLSHEARKPGNGYDGASGYYDIMLPSAAIINRAAQTVRIERVWVELEAGSRVLERSYVPAADVAAALKEYAEFAKLGFQVAMNAKFAADTVLPAGITVAHSSSDLAPGTAILVTGTYLLARGEPDHLSVVALGRRADGRHVVGRTTVPVRVGTTRNRYRFPVEAGAWYVVGYPGLDSHHRFTQSTEFALDITKVDSQGRWFRDQGRRWSDWYAYGARVLAAADGVVVRVQKDSDLDPAVWRPRDGESAANYEERLEARQLKRFLEPGADPGEVAGGNYIILRHANGEYSHYAHLAYGSVLVRAGDTVKQGQVIARIGGTGEAPVVHLHFEVTDSADSVHFAFHSIPVDFVNVALPANARQSDEHGYFLVGQ